MKRFWEKVDKRGPKMPHMRSRCHVWTASVNNKGYGKFGIHGKTKSAHRVAWFLRNGAWPKQNLLHACDNPPCVRYEHLREGTQAENIADIYARGRQNNPVAAANRAKIACPEKHPYNETNTYHRPDGSRGCKICQTARSRAWRARRRRPA